LAVDQDTWREVADKPVERRESPVLRILPVATSKWRRMGHDHVQAPSAKALMSAGTHLEAEERRDIQYLVSGRQVFCTKVS